MIAVDELTRKFRLPGGGHVLAVDRVSFIVNPGEVYGLMGPNGAGKTTTLRMLLGLIQPTSGQATIDGYRFTDDPDEVRRRIGHVSTSAGLYPNLSVREMLLFFADLYGTSPDRGREELLRLSKLLEFFDLLERRCGTLSTGQRQRVNFARALIHQPPVVLLDEPTSGLDVFGSREVEKFVDQMRKEGKAVILTTHRLDEAERLCDRFGLLHKGRLIREGTLVELQRETGCSTLVAMFLKLADAGSAATQSPAS